MNRFGILLTIALISIFGNLIKAQDFTVRNSENGFNCLGDTVSFWVQSNKGYVIDSVKWYFIQDLLVLDSAIGFEIKWVFDTTTTNTNGAELFSYIYYKDNNGAQKIAPYSYNYNVLFCPILNPKFSTTNNHLCAGNCTSFMDSTDRLPTEWRWFFPGGEPNYSEEKDPKNICYETEGQYDVTLIVSNPVSIDTVVYEKYISVLPIPTIENDTNLVVSARFGDTLQLHACANGARYQWSGATNLSCFDCANPIWIADKNTNFECLVSQDAFCDVVCKISVRLSDEDRIYVPNIFSPNGDGQNDWLEIFGIQFELIDFKIFDRWGGLVFQTANQQFQWNGISRNKQLAYGVFIWQMTYRDLKTNRIKVKSGDVTLAR